MKIPTPEQYDMKWLPKRKTLEEKQYNRHISNIVDRVVRNIKRGYLRFECYVSDPNAREAVAVLLAESGWGVCWVGKFEIELSRLDSKTTE